MTTIELTDNEAHMLRIILAEDAAWQNHFQRVTSATPARMERERIARTLLGKVSA